MAKKDGRRYTAKFKFQAVLEALRSRDLPPRVVPPTKLVLTFVPDPFPEEWREVLKL